MQVICDLQHALQKSFNRNENTGPLKLSPFFKKQNKKQTKKLMLDSLAIDQGKRLDARSVTLRLVGEKN